MKTTRLLLCIALCSASTLFSQTFTYQDVNQLIAKSEKDSVAYIERLAALEFHKLINEYRKENDLNEIKWNETLWVATINHNTWMDKANNLTHHQKPNTKYFTGDSPGDRLDFAAGGNSDINWSGENALYNYSSYGDSKEGIAKNIAQRSFEQWKASPGHNQNMLGKGHGSHGVAFHISNDRVWGTDLFSSAGYDYVPSPTTFYADTKPKTSSKKSTKRFSTYKTKQIVYDEVSTSLRNDLKLKNRNFSKKDDHARRLAYRLANTKKRANANGVVLTESTQVEERKFFGLIKKQIHTYSAVLERDVDTFDSNEVSKELSAMLQNNQPLNGKSKIDMAVILKKRKDKVRVTLVSVISNPA